MEKFVFTERDVAKHSTCKLFTWNIKLPSIQQLYAHLQALSFLILCTFYSALKTAKTNLNASGCFSL